mgnify:FL=1
MIFQKINKYRFSLWIAVFLVLLIGIPFSVIVLDAFFLAKTFGVLLVLTLLVAIKYWFAVSRNTNLVVPRVVLNKNDLFDLYRDFKKFKNASSFAQDLVLNRIGIVLSKVKLVNQKNEILDRRQAIQLSYVFICENWTDDFQVDSNWVFVFSDDKALKIDEGYKYQLLSQRFSEEKSDIIPPEST